MFYLILMVCMNGSCGTANVPEAFKTEKSCTDTGNASLPKKVTASIGGEPFTYDPAKGNKPKINAPVDFYIGQVEFFICLERKE